MKQFERLLFSWFGKQSFWIKRKGYWYCNDLNMWVEDPWASSTLAKHNWHSHFYTRSRRKAFQSFEESIDLGIDCTMEHDAVLFNRRIALWDYKSIDQEGFGGKK